MLKDLTNVTAKKRNKSVKIYIKKRTVESRSLFWLNLHMNIKDNSGKLFYIGGVVRDELLGVKCLDTDITYVGNAIDDCQNLGEVIRINPDFGTIRVKIDNKDVDIASTRSEIYPKAGHLPVIDKIGCSLKEDVLRRDFTINALAKCVKTGEIIDYTGGLNDIKHKTLKVLHNKSFIDDPTRILRLLKFSLRLNFNADAHTKELMSDYLNDVNYDMCYSRIKKELKETFNLNNPKGFDIFFDEKIYKLITPKKQIKPEINPYEIIKFMQDRGIGFKHLWLAYIGVIADLDRLTFTKQEQKILDDYNNLKSVKLKTDLEIYKNYSALAPESLVLLGISAQKENVLRYIKHLKDIKLKITGKDLLELGLKPSEKYSVIFDKVLEYKLKHPEINKSDELNFVKSLI